MPVTPLTAFKRFSFRLRNLNPPTAHRVNLDDRIYIWWVAEDGPGTLYVKWRVQDHLGDIVIGGEEIQTPSGPSSNYRLSPIPEGFLLGVSCYVHTQTQQGGYIWAEIGLARLEDPYPYATALLCQGYVDLAHSIGWPPGGPAPHHDADGVIRVADASNPGAGNEWSWFVPDHHYVEIVALWFLLTTSAVAGNRQAAFDVRDPGGILYRTPATVTQGASSLMFYSYSVMGPPIGQIGLMYYGNLPQHMLLQAGWELRSTSSNLKAGDAYSGIQVIYRRWLRFQM